MLNLLLLDPLDSSANFHAELILYSPKPNLISSNICRAYEVLYIIPKWLRNPLISTGFEPVLIHAVKSCIVSYYGKFFTKNNKPGIYLECFESKNRAKAVY